MDSARPTFPDEMLQAWPPATLAMKTLLWGFGEGHFLFFCVESKYGTPKFHERGNSFTRPRLHQVDLKHLQHN